MAKALMDRFVNGTGLTLTEWIDYWRSGRSDWEVDLNPDPPENMLKALRILRTPPTFMAFTVTTSPKSTGEA